MSFINPKKKEIVCKIVYAGAPFTGKSTSLRHLYKEMGGSKKSSPLTLSDETLFFDFVPLSLGKVNGIDIHFHLYTLPPQKAYDTTCKMILKGVDGIIFVVDTQIDKVQESFETLQELRKQVEPENSWNNLPLVFQYNKRDLSTLVPHQELNQLFNDRQVPEFETVATKGKNVLDAFQEIARQILLELKK